MVGPCCGNCYIVFGNHPGTRLPKKAGNVAAVKGQLEYMTCNDKKCLPPEDVDFSIPLGK